VHLAAVHAVEGAFPFNHVFLESSLEVLAVAELQLAMTVLLVLVETT
jgi:hypothetical protein